MMGNAGMHPFTGDNGSIVPPGRTAPPQVWQTAQSDVARLKTALRRERIRGRAGHWSYDLTRHLRLAEELRAALKAEDGQTSSVVAPETL